MDPDSFVLFRFLFCFLACGYQFSQYNFLERLFPIVHSWHHCWRSIDSIWMDSFLGSTIFPFLHWRAFTYPSKPCSNVTSSGKCFLIPQNLFTGVHRAFLPEHILQDLSIHSECLWICMCSMWGVITIWSVTWKDHRMKDSLEMRKHQRQRNKLEYKWYIGKMTVVSPEIVTIYWKKLMDSWDIHEAELSGFGAWLDLRVEGKSKVWNESILKFLSCSPENPVRFVGFDIKKSRIHWKQIHNAMLKNKTASNLYLPWHKGYQETPANVLHLTFTVYS